MSPTTPGGQKLGPSLVALTTPHELHFSDSLQEYAPRKTPESRWEHVEVAMQTGHTARPLHVLSALISQRRRQQSPHRARERKRVRLFSSTRPQKALPAFGICFRALVIRLARCSS